VAAAAGARTACGSARGNRKQSHSPVESTCNSATSAAVIGTGRPAPARQPVLPDRAMTAACWFGNSTRTRNRSGHPAATSHVSLTGRSPADLPRPVRTNSTVLNLATSPGLLSVWAASARPASSTAAGSDAAGLSAAVGRAAAGVTGVSCGTSTAGVSGRGFASPHPATPTRRATIRP